MPAAIFKKTKFKIVIIVGIDFATLYFGFT